MQTMSGDFSVDGFENGIGRERRRDVDRRRVSARLGYRLGDAVEQRYVGKLGVGVPRAALPGRHAADDLRAVGPRLFRVKRSLATGYALTNDLGRRVD